MNLFIPARSHSAAILLLMLLLAGAPALAEEPEGMYIGAGYMSATVDSNHPSLGRQTIPGFFLLAGFPFNEVIALEFEAGIFDGLTTGPTPDIYYPEDTAEYGYLAMGLRFAFPVSDHFIPWGSVSLSGEGVTWDTYWYSLTGNGLSLAAGLDYRITPQVSLRTEARMNQFKSETESYTSETYSVDTTIIGAGLTYQFMTFGP